MYRRKKKTRKSPLARTKDEKCITAWCRNIRARKTNGYYLKRCWKCLSRRFKEAHPWTYSLNIIRLSAKRRKLPFTLTVESFKAWCEQTGYLQRKGNKPESMTVDRIDWNEGYHIWNIQPLTHKENSEQGADNTPRDERADPGCVHGDNELTDPDPPESVNVPF